MRSFWLVPALLLGTALCQFPVFADGTYVGVCNAGKAEFDAYLVAGGMTYAQHVKPIQCVQLAESKGQMGQATIGIGFTDPNGQYVGAKRFDRLPDWNAPFDAQAGIPAVAREAHTTLAVKHGTASVTIPGLLVFQPGRQWCTSPPSQTGLTQAELSATTPRERQLVGQADAMIEAGRRATPQPGTVCTYPGYQLTVSAYPETHEVALDEQCTPCQVAKEANKTPEQKAQDQQIDAAAYSWARSTLNVITLGGAVGVNGAAMLDEQKAKDDAEKTRRVEIAKGPYSMDWEHLSTFVTSAFSRAKVLIPNRYIILRGTISKVTPPNPNAEMKRYIMYFKEVSTLTKPPMDLPGDYFIQQYVGREDAFAICASDGAVLGDVFGANYATSMVGKTVEMQGELNTGTCGAAVGIRVLLAHQMKVVTASTPATKGQTFTPKFQPVSTAPAAAATPVAAATPRPAPDMNYVRDALAARGLGPNASQRGAQQPVTTASVTPVRPAGPSAAPAAASPVTTTPLAPPAPKRDPDCRPSRHDPEFLR